MPTTDDIAEKLSDIILDQGVRTGAFITKTLPPTVSDIAHATSTTIKNLREQIKKDKDLRRLMGLQGEVSEEEMDEAIRKLGYITSTFHVGDADAEEMAELLNERKILFARLDKANDNCKMFVFLTRDAQAVQECAELMQARRGLVTELNPALFFNSLSPEHIHEVAGMDAIELELFRHYARKEGLVFTAMPSADGKNSIYFNADDKDKGNRVMQKVGWMLSGEGKTRIREQLEHRLDGREKIRKSISDPLRELYIVSAKNPANYIHITAEDFTQYKGGKEVSKAERDQSGFAERCMAYCDSLEHPVVLAPDDFRSDLTVTDMSRYPTTDFMAAGFDEMQEMERMNDVISLVARKAGLDNEGNADLSLWDTSISFSAFAAEEHFEDNEERQQAEENYDHLRAAVSYPDGRFTEEDLNMDGRSLDFMIARAEDKKRYAQAPEREEERTQDGPFMS